MKTVELILTFFEEEQLFMKIEIKPEHIQTKERMKNEILQRQSPLSSGEIVR